MNEQMDRLWTKVDKRKIPEPQAMMNDVDYSLEVGTTRMITITKMWTRSLWLIFPLTGLLLNMQFSMKDMILPRYHVMLTQILQVMKIFQYMRKKDLIERLV